MEGPRLCCSDGGDGAHDDWPAGGEPSSCKRTQFGVSHSERSALSSLPVEAFRSVVQLRQLVATENVRLLRGCDPSQQVGSALPQIWQQSKFDKSPLPFVLAPGAHQLRAAQLPDSALTEGQGGFLCCDVAVRGDHPSGHSLVRPGGLAGGALSFCFGFCLLCSLFS